MDSESIGELHLLESRVLLTSTIGYALGHTLSYMKMRHAKIASDIIAAFFIGNALVFASLIVHPQPARHANPAESAGEFQRRTIAEYDRFTDENEMLFWGLAAACLAVFFVTLRHRPGASFFVGSLTTYLAAFASLANTGHAFYASYASPPASTAALAAFSIAFLLLSVPFLRNLCTRARSF